MPVCLLGGSLVSGPGRRTCGLVFLVFSLSFAAAPVRAEDEPDRPKSSQQPPGGGRDLTVPPGPLGLPKDEAFPPEPGMTLDQAIERLFKENLELRAAHDEIDMAEADIEAAGQPPLASFVINVEIDGIRARTARAHQVLPSRWFDTLVARAARRVLEAQYQDAVRLQLDNLYDAAVDVNVAEHRVAFARSVLQGSESLFKATEKMQKAGTVEASDMAQVKAEREFAAIALGAAETDLKKTRLVLGNLLNLPDLEGERLRVRNDRPEVAGPGPEPPSAEELIRRALRHRPDLLAHRLGVERAQADWLKALVEPLCQMNFSPWLEQRDPRGPMQAAIAPECGLGVVIALPATIRNRGALKRAEINVRQARTQLAKVERDVILDVRKARLEYEQARSAVDHLRKEIEPAARTQRDQCFQQFLRGEASLAEYLEAQRKYNERVKEYLDLTIRLRRNTLAINTAVGERILR
jgi:cobalt-zinc-cadmium efflux system outer membrane protein